MGSAHAIAHVFGKGDALKQFRRALERRSGKAGSGKAHGEFMQEFTRRVQGLGVRLTPSAGRAVV